MLRRMREWAGRLETEKRIGRLAGDARERAGLSQIDAAAELGVHQSLIAKVEAGQRRLMLSEAVLLAKIYGCQLDALNPLINEPAPKQGLRRRRIPTRATSRRRSS